MLPVVVAQSLFVALLWGATTALQKYTLRSVDPMTIFVSGSVFYTLCMIFYIFYNRTKLRKTMAEIPLKLWFIIASTAIIGGFTANLMYFHILKKHNSAIVAALTYSSPIFVLLLSVLFLKEPIHPITVIGILTAVFGVVLISYGSHISHEDLEMQSYV